VDIETIREQVRAGNYLVKNHAVQHALKEGFERKHMVEAISKGRILEEYADDQRVLICGKTTLSQKMSVYLHVVCELVDPVYVEFLTAYIPDELLWEWPPFKRRRQRKK
jgi:hypothetical protein